MADIELVIKIPEELYKQICEIAPKFEDCSLEWDAIAKGKVLPKGHGRLIDANALIPNIHGVKSITATLEAPTIIEADEESE